MVMEGTENDSVRTLADSLSDEQENDSENQEKNKIWLDDEDEEPKEELEEEESEEEPEEPETEKTEEEPEGEKEKTYTYSEFRSAVDKETNAYREKYEKVTEQNKELITQRNELKKQVRDKTNNQEFDALYKGDVDDEIDEDKARNLDNLRRKFKQAYDEYKDNAEELEEQAEVYSTIAKNMNQSYVKDFGLDDPNPHARAVNGLNLINEAIGLHETNTIYKELFEVLVAKGTELREKMDKSVTELQGLSKKNRQYEINKLRDELKITPKSAPPKPRDKGSGGKATFTRAEIAAMTPEQYEKNREAIQAALDAGRVK